METRTLRPCILPTAIALMVLLAPASYAFRASGDAAAPARFTYGPITSQPAASSAPSSSQGKASSQLSDKSRSLLTARYGPDIKLEINPSTGLMRRLRGVQAAHGSKGVLTTADRDLLLRRFVDDNPDLMGVKSSNLALVSQAVKRERCHLVYRQEVDGLPVYGAYLKVAFDSNGYLSPLTSSCWPIVKYSPMAALTEQETALLSARRIAPMKQPDKSPRYQLKSSEKVLFPLSTTQGTLFQVAYRQVIHTTDPLGDWVTVVDANTGREYVRYNNYRFATIAGTVQGQVFPTYYNNSLETVPFGNESIHTFSQTPAYSWDLSSNPGWSKQGLWAFGAPTGAGGDGGDNGPTAGHTGYNVFGYNLNGGYTNSIAAAQYLSTPPVDCSTLKGTHLAFWRWLGIESADYDHASLEVSNDGTGWVTVWNSYAGRVGHEWEYCVYDISATADGRSTVYIRWGMGPTDAVTNLAGLYIDDISVFAGGGVSITTAEGDFEVPSPVSGAPVIQSELKGPYADVVNEDAPRLRFSHTSLADPAGWDWTIPPLTVTQSWNLDTNPGWTTTGDWAWGKPLGSGGDPTQGQTGQFVYGYNLGGTYPDGLGSVHSLTTSAIDCTGYTGTHLRFWRWLGIESSLYDSASIQVSNDNSTWYTVYQNPTSSLQDASWRQVSYDISYVADGRSTVYIRWNLGPTDTTVAYSGWNIDGIELLTGANDPDLTVGLYDADEPNVFYHMGIARESIKAIDPSFAGLDYQMPAVVRVGSDYANAYFDGTGLNFGEGDGASFRNLAHFADVIYHEYGHAITHHIYPADMLPYTGEPGAMDEAWSDYSACTITNEPMIGEGGAVIGGLYLRNMENNLMTPEDVNLEVHDDGRIIGAGLWSLRVLIGKQAADHLIHFARFNLAESFADYYEDLLLTDDTDSDLANGTPHMFEIARAFGPHGIGGLRVESVSQEASSEITANGILDAGEAGQLLAKVVSHFNAEGVELAAQTTSPYLSISDATVAYGAMAYSSSLTQSSGALAVSISPSCPEDEVMPVAFTLTAAGGYSSTGIHRLINAPGQILYDEGARQGAFGYGAQGGGFAVRFTPPRYPLRLTTLRLMTDGPYTGVDPVSIQVKAWDDDGPGGGPGTLLTPSKTVVVPASGTWFETPLVFDQRKAAYAWNLESNPAWTTQSGWQRGAPAGAGGDPATAYSGTSVYGYNLYGTYQNNMVSARYLSTKAIDCRNLEGATLEFQRWLGVERSIYDHASVEVSNNNSTWTKVWENGDADIADTAWTPQSFDISAAADGKQTVHIRWGMGPTDDSLALCGWNIDDVVITSRTGVIDGITVNEGDVFVGWVENEAAFYNGVTWKRPDNRSWVYDTGLKQWSTLASAGYPLDLMVRLRYEVPTGVQIWSEY